MRVAIPFGNGSPRRTESLGNRRLRGLGRGIAAPGEQKYQGDSDANAAVGQVECGKANDFAPALLQIKEQEIDHMTDAEAVHQVSHDTADDQSKSHLSEQSVR